jgi:hypothetical protein
VSTEFEFSYLSVKLAELCGRTGRFLVQSGIVTPVPLLLEARSLCSLSFLRAALSGTVMKMHSLPKAVQFWPNQMIPSSAPNYTSKSDFENLLQNYQQTHSNPVHKSGRINHQGCVLLHRDFLVRHSTQELIGRGFRLRTTRDCNTCCPGSGIAHFRAIC